MSDDQWGVGDKSKWSYHGEVIVGEKKYPLIYGEHPHSRSDNNHYVDIGYKEPIGFSGHRILIDVQLISNNYLKSSGLSGDEIRKAVRCNILADRELIYSFGYRDVQRALIKAAQLITELSEHSSGWIIKTERNKLVGRPIFYREIPATIRGILPDQGWVIISTVDGKPFPPPVYNNEGFGYEDEEVTIKTDVLDPHIWWFRNTN